MVSADAWIAFVVMLAGLLVAVRSLRPHPQTRERDKKDLVKRHPADAEHA